MRFIFVFLVSLSLSSAFYGETTKYYKDLIINEKGWQFSYELLLEKDRQGWFYKVILDSRGGILRYERYSFSAPHHIVYFENNSAKKSEERWIIKETIFHQDGRMYEIEYFNTNNTKLFSSQSITNQMTGYIFETYFNQKNQKLKTIVYNKEKKPLYQFFYNVEGKVFLEEYYLNGKIYLTQSYNQFEQLIKKEEYWEDREEYYTTLFYYNTQGQEIRRVSYLNENYQGYYNNYYSNKNFLSQEFISSKGDNLYQIKYFSNISEENEVPPQFVDPIPPDNLNPSRYFRVYYDNKGRIAKYETYLNRHLFAYSKYYYDVSGKLATEENYNKERPFLIIKYFNLYEKNLGLESWEEVLPYLILVSNEKIPIKIERYNKKGEFFSYIMCYYNRFGELNKYEIYHSLGKLYTVVYFLNGKPAREEFYNPNGQISILKEYDLKGNLNSTHFIDGSSQVESGTPEFVEK